MCENYSEYDWYFKYWDGQWKKSISCHNHLSIINSMLNLFLTQPNQDLLFSLWDTLNVASSFWFEPCLYLQAISEKSCYVAVIEAMTAVQLIAAPRTSLWAEQHWRNKTLIFWGAFLRRIQFPLFPTGSASDGAASPDWRILWDARVYSAKPLRRSSYWWQSDSSKTDKSH